jgi:beta-glucosidase
MGHKDGFRACLAGAVVAATLAYPGAASAQVDCSTVPWMDKTRTADARARALLDASSLDQKLRWLDEQSANNPTQTSFGIGGGQSVTMPAQVPCTPVIQYTDSPSAIVGAGTGITAFPAQIALSATWDEALSRRKGKAQGYEAFHKHRNVILAPGIASGRTPLSGRTAEYLGEDPLLSGVLAAAVVRGFGDNPNEPVESVLKHYVANEQELDRQTSSSNIDDRTLREIYTLPFEIAIKQSTVGGVMCAFNQVNHVYACENRTILRTILKEEIGFDGWVVTDFGAIHSLASTPNSLAAGLDQELNRWRFWNPNTLKAALAAGTITQAQIDDAALRVVRAHIRAGLFDVPLPPAAEPDVSTPQNQAVAREVVEKGSVLLKNGGLLPLRGTGRRIAVIGPTASSTPTNGISAASVCAHTAPNVPCTPKAPLDSIQARAAQDGGTVVFNNGSDLASAAAAASGADVAIVFGYYREGEFADRPNISLDGNGDALISAVAAANPNTAVVLQTGGPVLTPWIGSVAGALQVWYAGQEMGPAIASLLWGDVNPSGKLTMSFPRSEADLPTAGSTRRYPGVFSNGSTTRPPGTSEIRQVDFSEGLKVGYRWYDSTGIEPQFAFGHGLSYTTFAIDQLQVPASAKAGTPVTVRFRVTNTGSRTGTEIPQVYLGMPASIGEPPKRLVGWERVTLDAGQSRTVELTIDPNSAGRPFSYWAGGWHIARGPYTISVGSSSRAIAQSAGLSVVTEATGTVGGTVPATLTLTLGPAATFPPFTPGVANDYTASTTATIISTAGDATLSVTDPSPVATGHLVNGAFSLPSALKARAGSTAFMPLSETAGSPLALLTYTGPVSNDQVTVAFQQHIGSSDALRTGTYSKTLTFTLSTTNP